MCFVSLQDLPDEDAKAAHSPIHFKHNPQLLVGLFLRHAEGVILDVILPHHQYVRWTLACQIRQVHGYPQFIHRFGIHGFPDRIVCIEVARLLLVLA
ncbi:hypothetical protein D3C79_911160 [compost metagenome]